MLAIETECQLGCTLVNEDANSARAALENIFLSLLSSVVFDLKNILMDLKGIDLFLFKKFLNLFLVSFKYFDGHKRDRLISLYFFKIYS